MAGEAVVAFNVSQLPICGVEQENCNNLSYVKIHRTAGLSGVIVQEDVGSQHIALTQNWAQLPSFDIFEPDSWSAVNMM